MTTIETWKLVTIGFALISAGCMIGVFLTCLLTVNKHAPISEDDDQCGA